MSTNDLIPTVVSRLQSALLKRGLNLSPRLELHSIADRLLDGWGQTLRPDDFEHVEDAVFEAYASLVVAQDALSDFDAENIPNPVYGWLRQSPDVLNVAAAAADKLFEAIPSMGQLICRVALERRFAQFAVDKSP